ncbi:MAG: c-type cytochrome biogenesis protein CcsB [Nitrospirota bacterium]|nr:c-type cytochrome biogenesis protein CcsB [Nitrospirota bacterium]MDH5768739.1 c-type cytochrome biogenesis protein CcsB [Nitrospirota bacterium]
MDSSSFFGISTIAYILAMIIYIIYLAFRKTRIGIAATTITIVGFISQTLAIAMRWKEFNDLSGMGFLRSVPLTNLYESMIFFVWCLILGYLIIEFKYKNRSFGAFVTPIAGLALAFIDISGMSKDIHPLVPALQSNWLLAHVMMSFIAYAAFALSFSTGLMYLILTTEKRNESGYIFWTFILGTFVMLLFLMGIDFFTFRVAVKPDVFIKSYMFRASFLNPSIAIKILSWIAMMAIIVIVWRYGSFLKMVMDKFGISAETLDEITYKSIAVGFPVFTLGGLIFGAIWADQAWGTYWSWDPKETWSLITWFVYAFYLHSRMVRGWRGKKVAIVAVTGFVVAMFTYVGVNLLLSGLHSYGDIK